MTSNTVHIKYKFLWSVRNLCKIIFYIQILRYIHSNVPLLQISFSILYYFILFSNLALVLKGKSLCEYEGNTVGLLCSSAPAPSQGLYPLGTEPHGAGQCLCLGAGLWSAQGSCQALVAPVLHQWASTRGGWVGDTQAGGKLQTLTSWRRELCALFRDGVIYFAAGARVKQRMSGDLISIGSPLRGL